MKKKKVVFLEDGDCLTWRGRLTGEKDLLQVYDDKQYDEITKVQMQ